jgi:hypothetical protein
MKMQFRNSPGNSRRTHSSAQTPPLRLEPTTKTAVWPWGSSGGGSGPG